MKKQIKAVLESTFPAWTITLQSIRSRRFIEKQCKALGLTRLAAQLSKAFDKKIFDGIFEGMVICPDIFPQHLAPKYLGTYEDELNPFLRWCIREKPDGIVNVGSAEGYYAVGLARHLPNIPIFAFDADPKARHATKAHAYFNDVHNIIVRGIATPDDLSKILSDFAKPLLILDCEGYEEQLICSKRVKNLEKAIMLIETHPNVVPRIEKIIESELYLTHRTQFIMPVKNKPIPKCCAKYCNILHPDALAFVTDERRGDNNRWICAIPNSIASPLF